MRKQKLRGKDTYLNSYLIEWWGLVSSTGLSETLANDFIYSK